MNKKIEKKGYTWKWEEKQNQKEYKWKMKEYIRQCYGDDKKEIMNIRLQMLEAKMNYKKDAEDIKC